VIAAIELGYMLDVAEGDRWWPPRSARSPAGLSLRTTTRSATTSEWLKHIDISRDGDGEPVVSYSPVTITRWEPVERTY